MITTVEFDKNIRAQFEEVARTAPKHEAECKCFEIVTSQRTGIKIVKAGKIFDEVFKDNKRTPFPIAFGIEVLKLKEYYKFALIKSCGMFSDCIGDVTKGTEDSSETGISLSGISRDNFNAFLNKLYDENRSCTAIDTVRLLEIANYLRADALISMLVCSLKKEAKGPFKPLLALNQRIYASPIRFLMHDVFKCFGKPIALELSRNNTEASYDIFVEKLATANVVSLNFDIAFPLIKGGIGKLALITSLTELSLPHTILSDQDLKSFSTRIVSLELKCHNIMPSAIPTQLTCLKVHELGFNLRNLKLPRLVKFEAFNRYERLQLHELSSLQHITELRLSHYEPTTMNLKKIPPNVKKLKLTHIYGNIADGTKHLSPNLTDLTLGTTIIYRLEDEAIMNVPRSLTRLVVLSNQTTNEAYKNLPPLKHLVVDLHDSKITKEVIPYLPKTLVYVHFKSGVFPKAALASLPEDCEVDMI